MADAGDGVPPAEDEGMVNAQKDAKGAKDFETDDGALCGLCGLL